MTEGADNIVAFVLSALNCIAAYFLGRTDGVMSERRKYERVVDELIREVNKKIGFCEQDSPRREQDSTRREQDPGVS